MKHLFTLGAAKTIFERAAVQGFRVVTVVNTLLLVKIGSLLGTDWKAYLPWLILGAIGTATYILFDVFILMPQEQEFTTKINPVMKEMYDDIKEIKKKLGEKQ